MRANFLGQAGRSMGGLFNPAAEAVPDDQVRGTSLPIRCTRAERVAAVEQPLFLTLDL